MPEVDPVTLKLIADNGQYLSTLRSTTTRVDQLLGTQEKRAKMLEVQFARSSGAISGHLRGITGALAGFFTGRELIGLVDNFTRLQNALRVAGLEGDNLTQVQDELFASAQRNGVAVNTLADLYGKAAASQKDLGASQAQLLQLTDLTAKSLLVTGTSTEQASGAILGLGQALGNTKLQAEEFNQINEGGLRPLLQAAAAGERFGGSVSKLRQAVVAGKVSNKEFFDLILKGANDIEQKAAKATLTLSAGFTTLDNALIKYFGEADKANGVSAALGGALGKLADNLDVIIPALAIIATAMGGRVLASMLGMTGAAAASSTAMFALRARMAGAATTAEALALTSRAAGASLLGAFGGPVGLAITAVALGIGYVASSASAARIELAQLQAETDKLTGEAESIEKALRAAGVAIDTAGDKAGGAAGFMDVLAASMLRATNQAMDLAKSLGAVKIAELNNQLADVRGQREKLRSGGMPVAPSATGDATLPSPLAWLDYLGDPSAKDAQLAKQEQLLTRQIDLRTKAMEAGIKIPDAPASAAAPTAGGSGGGGKKGGGTDRTAQTAARVQDELDRLNVELLQSVAEQTNSAEDRAIAEEAGLRADRASFDRQIQLDSSLNDAQRRDLTAARDAADSQARRSLSIRKAEEMAREQFERESAANELEAETVDARGRVNDRTAREKRVTELRKVDLEFSQREADAMRAYEDATARGDQLAADIARSKLSRIMELRQLAQEEATLRNQSPLEALRDQLNVSTGQMNEALEDVAARGLRSLEDGLVNSIAHAKNLGDVFKGVANQIIADLIRIAVQQSIIKPLAGLLGGGLGGIFGGIGSILGFADGTNNAPPGMAWVGERGPELVRFRGGEQVIPNHALGSVVNPNGRLSGGGTTVSQSFTINVDAHGALLAGQVQQMVAAGVQQATAMGSQVGAGQGEARVFNRLRRTLR